MVAVLKCCPVTSILNSTGDAESDSLVISISLNLAFPAPAPPVALPIETMFSTLNDIDLSRILFGKDLSILSPWIGIADPSNVKNASNAIVFSSVKTAKWMTFSIAHEAHEVKKSVLAFRVLLPFLVIDKLISLRSLRAGGFALEAGLQRDGFKATFLQPTRQDCRIAMRHPDT